jgi:hypothetical protein
MIISTSDIRKKYLPIFLNIFIVTGNQMFITSYGNKHLVSCHEKKMYETAPSKTIWVFSWLFNAFIYHFKY